MKPMIWKERKRLVAIVTIAATLFVGVWVVVAVVVPLVEQAPCAGIEFRTPAASQPSSTVRSRPAIGGQGGLAGKVQSALRSPGDTVYCHDFADPFVLRTGAAYYAYSTNTADAHVPVLTSGGLFGTGRRSDALPQLPTWSPPGRVWAPAVLVRPEGFVLYYATQAPSPDRQCLSRAIAARPGGPFIDDSSAPLVCPAHGGAIDASPFVDADGRAYLLWKESDDTTGIVAQELSPDGLSLIGPVQPLLQADQAWEAGVVEAPSMVASGGRYYVFYSGNDWESADYAIGYAVCDSPLGPCTKPLTSPWLASTGQAQGPGGPDVFSDGQGQLWFALHAWIHGKVGYPDGARNLFVARLAFVNGEPVIG
jgi:hypothetical protein